MYIKAVKCGNASTLEAGSSSMEVQGQPVLQMGWECMTRSWREGGRKVERTGRITETQLPWAPLTSDHICLKVSTGIHTCPLVYLTCLPLTSLVPYLSTFQPTIPILKTAKVFKDIYFQTKIISSWQSIKLLHKKNCFCWAWRHMPLIRRQRTCVNLRTVWSIQAKQGHRVRLFRCFLEEFYQKHL